MKKEWFSSFEKWEESAGKKLAGVTNDAGFVDYLYWRDETRHNGCWSDLDGRVVDIERQRIEYLLSINDGHPGRTCSGTNKRCEWCAMWPEYWHYNCGDATRDVKKELRDELEYRKQFVTTITLISGRKFFMTQAEIDKWKGLHQ